MISSEPRWDVLPIEKRYQRDAFDCGYRVLNEYLKKYARQNHQKGIAKTFVAIPALVGLKVDGYYTISFKIKNFLFSCHWKALLESLISSFIYLFLLNLNSPLVTVDDRQGNGMIASGVIVKPITDFSPV